MVRKLSIQTKVEIQVNSLTAKITELRKGLLCSALTPLNFAALAYFAVMNTKQSRKNRCTC